MKASASVHSRSFRSAAERVPVLPRNAAAHRTAAIRASVMLLGVVMSAMVQGAHAQGAATRVPASPRCEMAPLRVQCRPD